MLSILWEDAESFKTMDILSYEDWAFVNNSFTFVTFGSSEPLATAEIPS